MKLKDKLKYDEQLRQDQQLADDFLLAMAMARFQYASQVLDGFKWGLVTACVIVPMVAAAAAVATKLGL